MIECSSCGLMVNKNDRKCPRCGHVFDVKKKKKDVLAGVGAAAAGAGVIAAGIASHEKKSKSAIEKIKKNTISKNKEKIEKAESVKKNNAENNDENATSKTAYESGKYNDSLEIDSEKDSTSLENNELSTESVDADITKEDLKVVLESLVDDQENSEICEEIKNLLEKLEDGEETSDVLKELENLLGSDSEEQETDEEKQDDEEEEDEDVEKQESGGDSGGGGDSIHISYLALENALSLLGCDSEFPVSGSITECKSLGPDGGLSSVFTDMDSGDYKELNNSSWTHSSYRTTLANFNGNDGNNFLSGMKTKLSNLRQKLLDMDEAGYYQQLNSEMAADESYFLNEDGTFNMDRAKVFEVLWNRAHADEKVDISGMDEETLKDFLSCYYADDTMNNYFLDFSGRVTEYNQTDIARSDDYKNTEVYQKYAMKGIILTQEEVIEYCERYGDTVASNIMLVMNERQNLNLDENQKGLLDYVELNVEDGLYGYNINENGEEEGEKKASYDGKTNEQKALEQRYWNFLTKTGRNTENEDHYDKMDTYIDDLGNETGDTSKISIYNHYYQLCRIGAINATYTEEGIRKKVGDFLTEEQFNVLYDKAIENGESIKYKDYESYYRENGGYTVTDSETNETIFVPYRNAEEQKNYDRYLNIVKSRGSSTNRIIYGSVFEETFDAQDEYYEHSLPEYEQIDAEHQNLIIKDENGNPIGIKDDGDDSTEDEYYEKANEAVDKYISSLNRLAMLNTFVSQNQIDESKKQAEGNHKEYSEDDFPQGVKEYLGYMNASDKREYISQYVTAESLPYGDATEVYGDKIGTKVMSSRQTLKEIYDNDKGELVAENFRETIVNNDNMYRSLIEHNNNVRTDNLDDMYTIAINTAKAAQDEYEDQRDINCYQAGQGVLAMFIDYAKETELKEEAAAAEAEATRLANKSAEAHLSSTASKEIWENGYATIIGAKPETERTEAENDFLAEYTIKHQAEATEHSDAIDDLYTELAECNNFKEVCDIVNRIGVESTNFTQVVANYKVRSKPDFETNSKSEITKLTREEKTDDWGNIIEININAYDADENKIEASEEEIEIYLAGIARENDGKLPFGYKIYTTSSNQIDRINYLAQKGVDLEVLTYKANTSDYDSFKVDYKSYVEYGALCVATEQYNNYVAKLERRNDVEDWFTTVGYGALAGGAQFVDGFKNLLDPDGIRNASDYRSMLISSYLLNEYGSGAFNSNFMLGTYEVTTSLANMLPTVALSCIPTIGPVLSLCTMFMSTAGNATEQGLQSGMTMEQARIYGLINGALETGLQATVGGISSMTVAKLPIAKLLTTKIGEKFVVGSFKSAALNYILNMFSEGLEEGAQEIIDPIVQRLINASESNFIEMKSTMENLSLEEYQEEKFIEWKSDALSNTTDKDEYLNIYSMELEDWLDSIDIETIAAEFERIKSPEYTYEQWKEDNGLKTDAATLWNEIDWTSVEKAALYGAISGAIFEGTTKFIPEVVAYECTGSTLGFKYLMNQIQQQALAEGKPKNTFQALNEMRLRIREQSQTGTVGDLVAGYMDTAGFKSDYENYCKEQEKSAESNNESKIEKALKKAAKSIKEAIGKEEKIGEIEFATMQVTAKLVANSRLASLRSTEFQSYKECLTERAELIETEKKLKEDIEKVEKDNSDINSEINKDKLNENKADLKKVQDKIMFIDAKIQSYQKLTESLGINLANEARSLIENIEIDEATLAELKAELEEVSSLDETQSSKVKTIENRIKGLEGKLENQRKRNEKISKKDLSELEQHRSELKRLKENLKEGKKNKESQLKESIKELTEKINSNKTSATEIDNILGILSNPEFDISSLTTEQFNNFVSRLDLNSLYIYSKDIFARLSEMSDTSIEALIERTDIVTLGVFETEIVERLGKIKNEEILNRIKDKYAFRFSRNIYNIEVSTDTTSSDTTTSKTENTEESANNNSDASQNTRNDGQTETIAPKPAKNSEKSNSRVKPELVSQNAVLGTVVLIQMGALPGLNGNSSLYNVLNTLRGNIETLNQRRENLNKENSNVDTENNTTGETKSNTSIREELESQIEQKTKLYNDLNQLIAKYGVNGIKTLNELKEEIVKGKYGLENQLLNVKAVFEKIATNSIKESEIAIKELLKKYDLTDVNQETLNKIRTEIMYKILEVANKNNIKLDSILDEMNIEEFVPRLKAEKIKQISEVIHGKEAIEELLNAIESNQESNALFKKGDTEDAIGALSWSEINKILQSMKDSTQQNELCQIWSTKAISSFMSKLNYEQTIEIVNELKNGISKETIESLLDEGLKNGKTIEEMLKSKKAIEEIYITEAYNIIKDALGIPRDTAFTNSKGSKIEISGEFARCIVRGNQQVIKYKEDSKYQNNFIKNLTKFSPKQLGKINELFKMISEFKACENIEEYNANIEEYSIKILDSIYEINKNAKQKINLNMEIIDELLKLAPELTSLSDCNSMISSLISNYFYHDGKYLFNNRKYYNDLISAIKKSIEVTGKKSELVSEIIDIIKNPKTTDVVSEVVLAVKTKLENDPDLNLDKKDKSGKKANKKETIFDRIKNIIKKDKKETNETKKFLNRIKKIMENPEKVSNSELISSLVTEIETSLGADTIILEEITNKTESLMSEIKEILKNTKNNSELKSKVEEIVKALPNSEKLALKIEEIIESTPDTTDLLVKISNEISASLKTDYIKSTEVEMDELNSYAEEILSNLLKETVNEEYVLSKIISITENEMKIDTNFIEKIKNQLTAYETRIVYNYLEGKAKIKLNTDQQVKTFENIVSIDSQIKEILKTKNITKTDAKTKIKEILKSVPNNEELISKIESIIDESSNVENTLPEIVGEVQTAMRYTETTAIISKNAELASGFRNVLRESMQDATFGISVLPKAGTNKLNSTYAGVLINHLIKYKFDTLDIGAKSTIIGILQTANPSFENISDYKSGKILEWLGTLSTEEINNIYKEMLEKSSLSEIILRCDMGVYDGAFKSNDYVNIAVGITNMNKAQFLEKIKSFEEKLATNSKDLNGYNLLDRYNYIKYTTERMGESIEKYKTIINWPKFGGYKGLPSLFEKFFTDVKGVFIISRYGAENRNNVTIGRPGEEIPGADARGIPVKEGQYYTAKIDLAKYKQLCDLMYDSLEDLSTLSDSTNISELLNYINAPKGKRKNIENNVDINGFIKKFNKLITRKNSNIAELLKIITDNKNIDVKGISSKISDISKIDIKNMSENDIETLQKKLSEISLLMKYFNDYTYTKYKNSTLTDLKKVSEDMIKRCFDTYSKDTTLSRDDKIAKIQEKFSEFGITATEKQIDQYLQLKDSSIIKEIAKENVKDVDIKYGIAGYVESFVDLKGGAQQTTLMFSFSDLEACGIITEKLYDFIKMENASYDTIRTAREEFKAKFEERMNLEANESLTNVINYIGELTIEEVNWLIANRKALQLTKESGKFVKTAMQIYQQGLEAASTKYKDFYQNFRDHGFKHALEVTKYAMELSQELNLSEAEIEIVAYSALAHDFGMQGGKVYIDESLITKFAKYYIKHLGKNPNDIELLNDLKNDFRDKLISKKETANTETSRIWDIDKLQKYLKQTYGNFISNKDFIMDVARSSHPLNSALDILANSEKIPLELQRMIAKEFNVENYENVATSLIALLAMSHSKSTSGIKLMDQKQMWLNCVEKLRLSAETRKVGKTKIVDYLNVEALNKIINDPELFEKLQDMAVLIRDGDAMSKVVSKDNNTETIMQNGEIAICDVSDVSGEKLFHEDRTLIDVEEEQSRIKEETTSGRKLDTKDDSYSKGIHAGELNTEYSSNYTKENGKKKYDATVIVKNSNSVPNSTLGQSILERLGELNTYTNMDIRTFTIYLSSETDSRIIELYKKAISDWKTKAKRDTAGALDSIGIKKGTELYTKIMEKQNAFYDNIKIAIKDSTTGEVNIVEQNSNNNGNNSNSNINDGQTGTIAPKPAKTSEKSDVRVKSELASQNAVLGTVGLIQIGALPGLSGNSTLNNALNTLQSNINSLQQEYERITTNEEVNVETEVNSNEESNSNVTKPEELKAQIDQKTKLYNDLSQLVTEYNVDGKKLLTDLKDDIISGKYKLEHQLLNTKTNTEETITDSITEIETAIKELLKKCDLTNANQETLNNAKTEIIYKILEIANKNNINVKNILSKVNLDEMLVKNNIQSVNEVATEGLSNIVEDTDLTEEDLKYLTQEEAQDYLALMEAIKNIRNDSATVVDYQKIDEIYNKIKRDNVTNKWLYVTDYIASMKMKMYKGNLLEVYELEVKTGTGTKKIKINKYGKNAEALTKCQARLAVLLEKVPPFIIETITEINLYDYDSNADMYFSVAYNGDIRKPFYSGASSNGSQINIWKCNLLTLDEETLFHELGHNVDVNLGKYEQTRWWTTKNKEWEEAIKKDGGRNHAPSDYAKTNTKEDFAESFAYYMINPSDFTEKFPNRAEVIENILDSYTDVIDCSYKNAISRKTENEFKLYDNAVELLNTIRKTIPDLNESSTVKDVIENIDSNIRQLNEQIIVSNNVNIEELTSKIKQLETIKNNFKEITDAFYANGTVPLDYLENYIIKPALEELNLKNEIEKSKHILEETIKVIIESNSLTPEILENVDELFNKMVKEISDKYGISTKEIESKINFDEILSKNYNSTTTSTSAPYRYDSPIKNSFETKREEKETSRIEKVLNDICYNNANLNTIENLQEVIDGIPEARRAEVMDAILVRMIKGEILSQETSDAIFKSKMFDGDSNFAKEYLHHIIEVGIPELGINGSKELADKISKVYEKARETTQKMPNLYSYCDHTEAHVLQVAFDTVTKAKQIAASKGQTLSEIQIKNLFYTGLFHDLGMASGAELGISLETQIVNETKDKIATTNTLAKVINELNANVIRENHSLNSALQVLRMREELENLGLNADLIAMMCFSHSKSNSGVGNLSSAGDWSYSASKIRSALEIMNKASGENITLNLENIGGYETLETTNTDSVQKITKDANGNKIKGKLKLIVSGIQRITFKEGMLNDLEIMSLAIRMGDAYVTKANVKLEEPIRWIGIDGKTYSTNLLVLTQAGVYMAYDATQTAISTKYKQTDDTETSVESAFIYLTKTGDGRYVPWKEGYEVDEEGRYTNVKDSLMYAEEAKIEIKNEKLTLTENGYCYKTEGDYRIYYKIYYELDKSENVKEIETISKEKIQEAEEKYGKTMRTSTGKFLVGESNVSYSVDVRGNVLVSTYKIGDIEIFQSNTITKGIEERLGEIATSRHITHKVNIEFKEEQFMNNFMQIGDKYIGITPAAQEYIKNMKKNRIKYNDIIITINGILITKFIVN